MSTPSSRRYLCLLAALGTSACLFDVRVEDPARRPSGRVVRVYEHHFFAGAVGEGQEHVRDRCPDGASAVRTYGDALTAVVSLLTALLYTPRKIEIECAAPLPAPSSRAAPAASGGSP